MQQAVRCTRCGNSVKLLYVPFSDGKCAGPISLNEKCGSDDISERQTSYLNRDTFGATKFDTER